MSTANLPYGRGTLHHMRIQTDFATQATGAYMPFEVRRTTLAQRRPLVANDLLGRARQNQFDAVAPFQGEISVAGDIDVPLDLNQIGLHFTMMFGRPGTSGSSPNFTHSFGSGQATLPAATMAKRLSATYQETFLGVVYNTMRIPLGDTDGPRLVTFGLLGRSQLATTAAADTPTLGTMFAPDVLLGRKQCVVFVGGVAVGTALDGELEFSNNITPEAYLGTADFVSAMVAGQRTGRGRLRLRFNSSAGYRPEALAGTPLAVDFRFFRTGEDPARSLVIATTATFEQPQHQVTGPGGMEATYEMTLHQTATQQLLVSSLQNGQSLYNNTIF